MTAVGSLQDAVDALQRVLNADGDGSTADRLAVRRGIANGLAEVLMASDADDIVLREAISVAAETSGARDLLLERIMDAVQYSMQVDPRRCIDEHQFVNRTAPI